MQSDTTSIFFQPLSGALSNTPFAYLLHIDEFTILLDCGWSEDFCLDDIQELINHCSKVNAVLLSHGIIEHIGALPYLCQYHGLSAPIFATHPVASMGSLLVYDHYLNKLDEEEFSLFNAHDIEVTFSKINTMTYEQEEQLDGKNITIIPYRAGYSFGGAVWRIIKGQNEIIYSVSLGTNGLYLDGFEPKPDWHPTLWILDSRAPEADSNQTQRNLTTYWREIKIKLDNNKVVLYPIDGTSRALEILLQLETKWNEANWIYPIYFLSHSSKAILDVAQTNSEFLSQEKRERVTAENASPFKLTHITPITTFAELPIDTSLSYVVVASTDTLEHGFSRRVFYEVATRENLILITQREPRNSIAESLRTDNTHRSFEVLVKKREPLTGKEKDDYYQNQALQQDVLDISSVFGNASDSEDASDTEAQKEKITQVSQVSIQQGFQFKYRPPKRVTDFGTDINIEDYAKGVESATIMKNTALLQSISTNQRVLQEPKFEPSKFIAEKTSVHCKATALFFDFEGRQRFSALRHYIQKAEPSNVIIIGSEQSTTGKLKDMIRGSVKSRIFTPAINEKISLQRDLTTRKIALSRALLSGMDFKDCGIAEIGFIEAILKDDEHQGLSHAKPIDIGDGHAATFVGKLDISKLDERLKSMGMRTELVEGKLLCGHRRIEVRINGDHSISISGMSCPDLIKVRSSIQDLLTMV